MEGNNRPLYEEDQVITEHELLLMREGCIWQYRATKWWDWVERIKIRSAVGCINAMIKWMKTGKPVVRVHKGE